MSTKRKRSPAFPYVGINEVTQYLRAFYDASKGNFSPINLAFTSMGLKTTSSTSNRIMSTMLGYGILEDEGSRNDKKVKITQIGERLLKESREELLLRVKREAVLNDEMMNNVFSKYKNSLPNDAIMKSSLEIDFQFTEDAAKRFIKVIRDNYSYAELETYNYLLDQIDENDEKIEKEPQEFISGSIGTSAKLGSRKELFENKDYHLDFTLSLGISQKARLQISSKLSQDDFDFFLTWVKRLDKDIIKDTEYVEELLNDDIPF